VPFTERDVSRDRQAAMEMMQVSHQNGVPVIVVDGQVVVGFNRPLLEDLLGRMQTHRPSLGLRVADARAMVGKVPNLATQTGAYVGGVAPGSAAAAAGLAAGDIVVAVDGRPVAGAADLEREVGQSRGRAILTIIRQGQALQIPVSTAY